MATKKEEKQMGYNVEDILQQLYDAMQAADPNSDEFAKMAKTYRELYDLRYQTEINISNGNNAIMKTDADIRHEDKKLELEERKINLEERKHELEVEKIKTEEDLNNRRFDLEERKFNFEVEKHESDVEKANKDSELREKQLAVETKRSKSEARRGWVLGLVNAFLSAAAVGTMVAMHAKDWERNQTDMLTNPAGKEMSKSTMDALKRYWSK